MKATVSLADLTTTVNAVKGMLTRPTVPVLSGVLLTVEGDTLTLFRTDYERFVRRGIRGGYANGTALVGAVELANALKSLAPTGKAARTATVALAESDGMLEVSVDHGPIVRLDTMPVEDYPSWPTRQFEPLLTLSAVDLDAIVKGVVPACGKDMTIPMLTAVCIDANADGSTWAGATDRYVAARLRVDAWSHRTTRVIIPADTFKLLDKLAGDAPVDVSTKDDMALFRTADLDLLTRQHDDFPKLAMLFPADHLKTGTVDRKAMLDLVGRAAGLVPKDARYIRVSAGDDTIEVAPCGEGSATFTMRADTREFDLATVSFDPNNLTRALKAFNAALVEWKMTTPLKPQVFTADHSRLTWLVMPVRIGS